MDKTHEEGRNKNNLAYFQSKKCHQALKRYINILLSTDNYDCTSTYTSHFIAKPKMKLNGKELRISTSYVSRLKF